MLEDIFNLLFILGTPTHDLPAVGLQAQLIHVGASNTTVGFSESISKMYHYINKLYLPMMVFSEGVTPSAYYPGGVGTVDVWQYVDIWLVHAGVPQRLQ